MSARACTFALALTAMTACAAQPPAPLAALERVTRPSPPPPPRSVEVRIWQDAGRRAVFEGQLLGSVRVSCAGHTYTLTPSAGTAVQAPRDDGDGAEWFTAPSGRWVLRWPTACDGDAEAEIRVVPPADRCDPVDGERAHVGRARAVVDVTPRCTAL